MSSGFYLQRRTAPLPAEKDFDLFGDLDARWAWKNFGGLTLAQAWELFSQNPVNYQEDFMWMGPKAFAYYFPVIDRHLREAVPLEEDDDCLAWIIGCGVEAQLNTDYRFSDGFLREIRDLAAYMKTFAEKFNLAEAERKRITNVWDSVEAKAK